jgi:beta-galactosidase
MNDLKRFLAAWAVLSGVAWGTTIIPTDDAHVRSLDGQWRFKLEQDGDHPAHGKTGGPVPPAHLPKQFEPFEKPTYAEDAKWSNITVPGNWEMFGYSPATYHEPDSAIGLYRLEFDVPADWKGRVVKVNFDGIQNAAEVYLNGEPVNVDEPSDNKVNYHQGGFDAFQVDLTPAIKFGARNLLALRVYKNVNGVDLDTGDFFFLGGIHRTVTLFSVPQSHIEDVKVETRLLPDDKAELKVIITKSGPDTATPTITLEGANTTAGKSISDGPEKSVITEVLDHPKLWSAEKPNLYTLNVDLKDAAGNVVEHLTRRIGVREVSIKDGIFMVNNVPVKLTGMCRHDCYPTLGTALTEEIWRKDILLMKAANINAIRTSHYPYGSKFYDLCDELGMYVADEMAAVWVDTTAERFAPYFAQHARELVRRDKNHPSIIIWAIGNENKPGADNQIAADEIHKLDTTRPRLVSWRKGDEYGVDFDDLHYTQPKKIAEIAAMTERRKKYPLIFLENPNMWEARNGADYGCLDLWVHVIDRCWQEVWKDDSVPGSFTWEWQDRAVADKSPTKLYDYFPATGINLVKVKGIVDGFRNPRPAYYNLKMACTPIKAELKPTIDGSSVSVDITNRYSFTDLSELTTTWHLMSASKDLKSADVHPALAPRSHGQIKLDLPGEVLSSADTLRLEFAQPDGTNIATYDLHLKDEPDTTPKLDAVNLAGVHFPKFNLVSATWGSNVIGWRTCFRHPAKLVNIKVNKSASNQLAFADDAALYRLNLSDVPAMDADVVLADDPKATVAGHVHVDYANGKFVWKLDWTKENGTAKRRNPAGTDLQELGWTFAMPGSDDHFSWHRKGYWSYYPPDHIGRISGTALPDTMNVDITKVTRPDAFDFNTTKFNCDWASLTDATGHGIAVTFAPDSRAHCKAGASADGAHELVVNKYCSPPRDISSPDVEDLYFVLDQGASTGGEFRVGICGP